MFIKIILCLILLIAVKADIKDECLNCTASSQKYFRMRNLDTLMESFKCNNKTKFNISTMLIDVAADSRSCRRLAHRYDIYKKTIENNEQHTSFLPFIFILIIVLLCLNIGLYIFLRPKKWSKCIIQNCELEAKV